ncbi:MAG: SET domain-containing protein-lysine N-methyltransferase [Bacteroidota bacterium]|nr:SET domain-containing protein-lysine N-methyltransferase [Bacteroidota bacterium]
MKICVLQPDYSFSNVDYQHYDPLRNLSSLWPEAHFDHIKVNKLTTYKQLQTLRKKKYDIYVNLCEAYLEWEVPSIDVIFSLDLLNLPYTGPNIKLYDPPKTLMKYVAYIEGVPTPAYVLIQDVDSLDQKINKLTYPLFVKPAKAGDSLGIDNFSLVYNKESLEQKLDLLFNEYDEILIEEYINGREFTVLVANDKEMEDGVRVFKPVEYIFPDGFQYKTYSLKTSELHPDANIAVDDKALDNTLRNYAKKIFKGFGGEGYGRLDFRMNSKGELFFLEINFTCSVFYTEGFEGSADFILKFDGYGPANFLKLIVKDGISRYKARQKKFEVKGNSINGYGIYAVNSLKKGDIIFMAEGKPQAIITNQFVEKHWDADAKKIYRHYAYPLSEEVYILWDTDPGEWAPQNHSCEANTCYEGLNVIASRDIDKNEELTLDYSLLLNETAESFECTCGSPICKKHISGIPGNSVTTREIARNKKSKTLN